MHARAQIKQAVLTALAGLATTGNRVYDNRFYALAKGEANAIRVFGIREDLQPLDSTRMRERSMTLTVETVAKGLPDSVEATVNQICAEVEAVLDGKEVMNNVEAVLVGVEDTYDASGEHVIYSALMQFKFDYATRAGDAEVVL
jgi:hypothetical protein